MTSISIASARPAAKAAKKSIDKDTLSYRLTYALNALKVSQSELARQLNIKPQAIQYICANNVKKSQFTFEIAQALDISYTWLSAGKGNMVINEGAPSQNASFRIPILSEQEFISYMNKELVISEESVSKWTITNMQASDSCIALVNNENAMSPPFPKNTILIFDTQLKPKNHDFVLAYIKAADKLLFRQYVENDGEINLKPVDQTLYKDFSMTAEDSIQGVLTQTHYKLR